MGVEKKSGLRREGSRVYPNTTSGDPHPVMRVVESAPRIGVGVKANTAVAVRRDGLDAHLRPWISEAKYIGLTHIARIDKDFVHSGSVRSFNEQWVGAPPVGSLQLDDASPVGALLNHVTEGTAISNTAFCSFKSRKECTRATNRRGESFTNHADLQVKSRPAPQRGYGPQGLNRPGYGRLVLVA